MIKGFHHISAFTKSAKTNHYFYTVVLGLRFVKSTVNQENTSIRHLFYGDYQGNPGTLLTFFELKRAGRSYNETNYFSTVTLNIPNGTLSYWKTRLAHFSIENHVDLENQRLFFKDPDQMELSLIEVDDIILSENATKHSDIPQSNQIIGIFEAELTVKRPDETLSFLKTFLGLTHTNQHSQLKDTQQSSLTFVGSNRKSSLSRMGRGSIDHIAYTVSSTKELEELYQKAVHHHIVIEQYIERGYFKSLYVKEPNRLRIEIATETPGFTLDEPIEALGNKLALPIFLEDKRAVIEAQLEDFQ